MTKQKRAVVTKKVARSPFILQYDYTLCSECDHGIVSKIYYGFACNRCGAFFRAQGERR